ncbi:cellulose-binding protein, partial [Micromonospora sp. S4605]|uniref:cellulose binding domain-containing protein n=1 Tax=Micromonospora sp. S4605 TaxID=1420897 RepID=UPI000D977E67
MKRSRSLVLSLVTALTAAVGAVWVALPAFAAGATASFVKTSDWGSGWEGKYTITNAGGSTVNGWSVSFDLPAGTTVGSYWDALLTSSGQRHTFTNRSWNGSIAPGASVSFGFLGSGPGAPTNCLLNGAPLPLIHISEPTRPEP